MYWPKEGIETYGVIQVKLIKEDIMATYTVRTMQVKHLKVRISATTHEFVYHLL
jgi:receptor-type tyrosine-protein phosphatase gamma